MPAATDIGIDLGSSNITIYVKGKGIYLREPSVVAYDKDSGRIRAFGEEAEQMIGRSSGNIVGIHPIRGGAISNYVVTERMLRFFIQKSMGMRAFLKPRIVICIPCSSTDVERRALEQAAFQAGARDVFLVKAPIAAAMGAGLEITKASGSLVVTCGYELTEAAMLSLGGIVVHVSMKTAGHSFDEAIVQYLREEHGVFIGLETAETIKFQIGTIARKLENRDMEVQGRSIAEGLPVKVRLSPREIRESVRTPVGMIVEGIRSVLEKSPPDLAADIIRRGIVLTGGGAQMAGLADAVMDVTGIHTVVAENPETCVASGAGMYLHQMAELGKKKQA